MTKSQKNQQQLHTKYKFQVIWTKNMYFLFFFSSKRNKKWIYMKISQINLKSTDFKFQINHNTQNSSQTLSLINHHHYFNIYRYNISLTLFPLWIFLSIIIIFHLSYFQHKFLRTSYLIMFLNIICIFCILLDNQN